jgi:hypothetical protein
VKRPWLFLLLIAGRLGTLTGEETNAFSEAGTEEAAPAFLVKASDAHPVFSNFEERRRAVLEAYAAGGKDDHFVRAECLFELERIPEGLAEVNKGLDPLVPGNHINRWMHGGNTGFIAWPGLDCYLRYGGYLDAATKERYRRIYTGGVFYARLSTSNHKMMAAVTRYLATQIWGADAFHADPYYLEKDPYVIWMTAKANEPGVVWGTCFARDDPTGEKYLRSIIAATVKGGPGEYASRPYGAQNMLPLLTLADCAKDQELANKARIAWEVCLLQLAPAWLRGSLATFAPRSYPDTENQHPWGVAAIPWLYFGGVAPDLTHAKAAARCATDAYRLLSVILPAATDRSKPYIYRALINGWALGHFVNGTYALFSRSAKIGGRPFQGQSYPCGVMWDDGNPEHGTHLWITNPAADEPGKMGIHTHGVRPFEQEVLGRDALLFLFNILPDNPRPYALGYVPGGWRAMINDSASSGRIFLHYGSVLIVVTANRPFEWNPARGILAPASPPRDGDSEFRLKGLQSAIAVETASPGEFPAANPGEQLRAFRSAVLSKSTLTLDLRKSPMALYTNRLGDRLECVYDGADRINGKPVDYRAWPVSESPWTSRRSEADPLTVTDGTTERIYDFVTWRVSEWKK